MKHALNDYRFPKARKVHRCEYCGELIEIGLQHVQFVGVWQGDFQDWRMHYECNLAADTDGALVDGFESWSNERPQILTKETV